MLNVLITRKFIKQNATFGYYEDEDHNHVHWVKLGEEFTLFTSIDYVLGPVFWGMFIEILHLDDNKYYYTTESFWNYVEEKLKLLDKNSNELRSLKARILKTLDWVEDNFYHLDIQFDCELLDDVLTLGE